MSERTPEEEHLILTDDDGVEADYRLLGRLALNGKQYAILEDTEDEDSVIIFEEAEEDGEAVFRPIEDDAECEEVFYLFQAEADDYEIGPAE